jgi:basic amino acid/polyamine antiporter, APA family
MRTGGESGRQMGVWAAMAVVTGEAISLGIFLTPAGMAKSLGSPALLGAVWCAMAVMTLAGALCFTELAVRYPQAGGEYVYLRQGFGRRVAFLYGWMAAVVMYPGVAAALCVGTVPYVQALVPLPGWLARMLPALVLVGLGAVNYAGTRLSIGVMTTLNWLKVPVLVGLVVWALVWIGNHGEAAAANLVPLAARRAGSDPLIGAIAGAGISAFFCFGGWWEAGKIAGEVRDPRRTLPIAFTGGVLLVTAIYLLVSFSFVAVVPLEQIQSNTAFVAQFGQALFGAAGGRVLSACAVLSVMGGLMVLSMAVPRVTYALAREEGSTGPLKALGQLHPRFGSPANAVLLQTGMALAVLGLGAFDRILAFIIFSAVVFLALTVATLFRLAEPVRRWWFPLAPVVFLAGSGVLAAMLLLHSLWPSLMGAAVVLAGLPVRWLLVRGTKLAPAASTENQYS